jgi:hypothetical protein
VFEDRARQFLDAIRIAREQMAQKPA